MTQSLTTVGSAPIVVDISALQSADSRGRGIARYARSWCLALERERPDLVAAYCLSDRMAPPGSMDELTASGKVTYATPSLVGSARVYHQLAPFDLSQPATSLLPRANARQLSSATIYDLIPARDLPHQLIDPVARRRYRTRLELVRSLDHLQVLSESVGDELVALLGIDAARIAHVGAAPDAAFLPPQSRAVATELAIAQFGEQGLNRSYVLYPSGSHPRKNNERLILAWSLLDPEQRQHVQLVITGAFDGPTINHFHHLAAEAGIAGDVVVLGYVEDDQMVRLTQGAALVCFASLAEGYGLPIVEAIACETPVIASAVAPHDELLGAHALFDPFDARAIAQAISHALETPPTAATTSLQRWTEVGRRSGIAFDRLLSSPSTLRRRRPLQRRRPRVAVVSPLPPAPSGVAGYSYRLIAAMETTEKVELTCFSDGPTLEQTAPPGIALYRVAALRHVESLAGRFDDVVYVLGNSHHHLGALAMLRQRRGVVLSHDVRLTNLYRHANGDPGLAPGGLGRDIQRMYRGQLPDHLGLDGELRAEELDRYGVHMAREVIAASSGFLVTSDSAANLARIDAGAAHARRVGTLPFAIAAPATLDLGYSDERQDRPGSLRGALAGCWGYAPADDNAIYIAHFGIVDRAKSPELLIDAFAALEAAGELRLVFVGPIADLLADQLTDRAADRGVVDRVGFTGALGPYEYRAWMDRALIGVQLRGTTNGEASAAIGECLSAGLPTIVTDLGWSGELPESVAVHLPARATVDQLRGEIAHLIEDESLRRTLSSGGRIYAERHNFNYAARSLLHLLATRRAARQLRTG